MGCLSGKELQGKQLAVKRRFKQAVAPGHLARLSLQKDTLVERGNQISETVSCCAPARGPTPHCSVGRAGRGPARGPRGLSGRPVGPDGGGREMAGL